MGERTEVVKPYAAVQPKPQPQVPAAEAAMLSAIGMNLSYASWAMLQQNAAKNRRSTAHQAHVESRIFKPYRYDVAPLAITKKTVLVLIDKKLNVSVKAYIYEGIDPNDIIIEIDAPVEMQVGLSTLMKVDEVLVEQDGDESWAKMAQDCYIISDSRIASESGRNVQFWWKLDVEEWCIDYDQMPDLTAFGKATNRRIGNNR